MTARSDVPRTLPGLHVEHVDGEVVVYDPVQRDLHLLDGSAAAVWDLMDGSRSIDGICRELAARFDVPVDVLERDVVHVVGEFATRGLVIAGS